MRGRTYAGVYLMTQARDGRKEYMMTEIPLHGYQVQAKEFIKGRRF